MSGDPLNHIELLSTLSVPRYAPRLRPTVIPTAAWNDAPLFCLKLNDEWVSHVLGVLTAMDQPDTWIGTPEQIYAARQQVNEIMVAFMTLCDDCAVEFRIVDCDLQWRESEADEWISLGNVCGPAGEQGEQGEQGIPGTPGADGADGAPGAPGSPGADGADGIDGTDCNCGTPEPPVREDADDGFRCGSAIRLSELLRDKIHESYNSEGVAAIFDGAQSVLTVMAALFPAAIIGAAGLILAVEVFQQLIALEEAAEEAAFDDDWVERVRCQIFCILTPEGDVTADNFEAIAAAIAADELNPYASYAADLWRAIGFEWWQWSAWSASAVSPEACDCDCVETDCIQLWQIQVDNSYLEITPSSECAYELPAIYNPTYNNYFMYAFSSNPYNSAAPAFVVTYESGIHQYAFGQYLAGGSGATYNTWNAELPMVGFYAEHAVPFTVSVIIAPAP